MNMWLKGVADIRPMYSGFVLAVWALVLGLPAAQAETVAFWRLDASGGGLELRNLAGTNYAFEARNGGPAPSYRKPLARVPAWAELPASSRGGGRNGSSVLFGYEERAAGAYLCGPAVGRLLELDGRFTVEGWLRKLDDPPEGGERFVAGVRDGRKGWSLSLRRAAGAVCFRLQAAGAASGPVLDHCFAGTDGAGDFRWQHVALTYDAARGKSGVWELFVNGASKGCAENPEKFLPHGCPDLFLGGLAGSGDTFCGELDLWRVSDEPLPPARLLCRSVPKTLAFWPLGLAPDGAPVLADRSGCARDLVPGRDGGITGCADAALPAAGPADGEGHGCVQLEGGIGMRSVLVAPGLGLRCDVTNSFSVEGWTRRIADPGERSWHVIGTRDAATGWALSLRSNKGRVLYHLTVSNVSVGGRLQFESFFENSDVTGNRDWQHVALVYDASRHGDGVWELYLDGVSQGTIDNPVSPDRSHGAADLLLGGRLSFSSSFEGMLCRWRVSDGALAPEQLLCQAPDGEGAERLSPAPDPRDVARGLKIPGEAYCDQPCVGVLRDGSWVCVLTTGSGGEGERGQHVVSTVSRDKGKSWSPPADIEPAAGPEASWATCLVTPFDRVYAFYTYNGDNVTTLPGQTNRVKSAWHGWYAYKYSDDGGLSWSKERYRIPVRVTEVDRNNPWKGAQCHFWGVDKPSVVEGSVYFAFTKLGAWFASDGEGWVVVSDNLLTERNPGRVRFRLLPEGEAGIRNPAFGSVQEEHNLVALKGRELMCAFRTERFPAQSFSRDGGKTWTLPEPMAYAPGQRAIKSNRTCPKLFRTSEGRYLLLYHHHGEPGWGNRNPLFVSGGVLKEDGVIRWSEPELLLYDRDPAAGISYPDLIEQDGRFWIAETQKSVARVHELNRKLLEGLWAQERARAVSRDGLVADYQGDGSGSGSCPCPAAFGDLDGGGLTVDLWLEIDNVTAREILFSTLAGLRGVRVVTASSAREPTVQIELYDGNRQAVWSADPGLIRSDRLHHVVFVCDTRANLVSVLVDGVFCDGGEKRPFGWGRLPQGLGPVAGSGRASFSRSVRHARLYERPLNTSEAVANFRAGLISDPAKP